VTIADQRGPVNPDPDASLRQAIADAVLAGDDGRARALIALLAPTKAVVSLKLVKPGAGQ
jgi:hypothetical protein